MMRERLWPALLAPAALLVLLIGRLAGGAAASPGADPPPPLPPLAPTPEPGNVDTAFTYQGYLEAGGVPANGTYDFEFRLYNHRSGGTLIAGPLAFNGTAVVDGVFTVKLDFNASPFAGEERWLAVCAAPAGVACVNLSPRQELTAVPYALSLRPGASVSGDVALGAGALNLTSGGHGLRVVSAAGVGVNVQSAGTHGLFVDEAGYYGVFVNHASIDGLRVCRTGSQAACSLDSDHNGVEVGAAEDNGLRVISAGASGISIGHADGDGLFVCANGSETGCTPVADHNNGLEIVNAEDDGVHIVSAGSKGLYVGGASDGLYVESATDAGVEIGDAPYAFWAWEAGTDGYFVGDAGNGDGYQVNDAGDNGVEVNGATDYAGYFNGHVSITGTCVGCTLALFGVNGGARPLQPGDVVALAGLQPATVDNVPFLLEVVPATTGAPIVGIVQGWAEAPPDDGGENDDGGLQLVPRDGPAAPGDYVTLVTAGAARVRASADAGAIRAGDRLTVSEAGLARPLARVDVGGITVAEDAPVLGVALEDLAEGEALIWVLVNLR